MTLFWFAVVGMLLGVTGFLFWPIVEAQELYTKSARGPSAAAQKKGKKASGVAPHLLREAATHKQRNIEIFKERLNELEAEKAQGTLDTSAFEQLKIELEKALLNDVAIDSRPEPPEPVAISAKHWFIGALMALAVAVWSIGLYLALGRSDDYTTRLVMQAQGTLKNLDDGSQGMPPVANKQAPDLIKAIAMLKNKVKEDPKNVGKWFLLANSYAATQQYAKAAETFLEIEKIVPKNSPDYPRIKGSYAQALYLANDEKITEPVRTAILDTLTLDPKEPNALVLKGVESFEQEAYKQAISFWEQAKEKANPQLIAQFIDPSIAAAQEKLGITPATIVSKPAAAASGSAKIVVTVDIAPELKAKVSNEQVIFVFARPAGSKMPLAAERITVKDLPATIVLDDSKAAMPTAKLSSVSSVDITARISLSGQAIPQAGDLFATQANVPVTGSAPLKLLINQVFGATPAATSAAPTGAPSLRLAVDISPELKAKVNPEQIVFIFAKPHGGKMPLAVERLAVKDLPATVILDDSKAAMPTATLSSAEVVDITARVSLSGQAIAQPGDLFASQEQVQVKQAQQPIKILINQVMP